MKKAKQMIRPILAILLLVVALGFLTGCGNKKEEQNTIAPYEEPVKNMIEGMQNTNIELYMSSFPEFVDYEITQESLDQLMNEYITLYGQDIKISYKIINKEEISNDKLDEIEENVKTYFEHDCTVTKGYKLDVEQTVKGSKDQNIFNNRINVYEIDGKWYRITF